MQAVLGILPVPLNQYHIHPSRSELLVVGLCPEWQTLLAFVHASNQIWGNNVFYIKPLLPHYYRMLFEGPYCLLNSQAVFWVILGRALGAKPQKQKLIKTLWKPMCTRDNDNL